MQTVLKPTDSTIRKKTAGDRGEPVQPTRDATSEGGERPRGKAGASPGEKRGAVTKPGCPRQRARTKKRNSLRKRKYRKKRKGRPSERL